VDQIDARGGTNINKALKVALSQYSDAADNISTIGGNYIVFLTDGQPTVGETDTNVILKDVAEENKRRSARIFVFGVGDDVNAQFLDRLAQDNKADADYVRPSEDIEVKVTAFFDKVSSPVLTDVKLTATSTGKFNIIRYNSKVAYGSQDDTSSSVHDMCPSAPLPDIFKGGQLIVIGQFDNAGDVTFSLSGHQQGKTKVYTYKVNLPRAEDDNDFIPRLWASRKIGYLLDEIRLHRSQELIDEVIRLSKEFGIPTEFTSFLADEREAGISKEEARDRVGQKLDSASRTETGSWAVAQSANARQLRNQSTVPGASQRDMYVGNVGGAPSAAGGFNSYKGNGFGTTNTFRDANDVVVNVNTIQNVGTRTFYQRSNQWVDARYQAQKMYKIKQYSDAHFQLLEASPGLRQYSTLGEITVVLNGNAIQIGSDGEDKLTASEVKTILGNS
jgi:Ca-activated chloride channel homolog